MVVTQELTMLIEPRPLPNFVETPYIQGVVRRALNYVAAGFPVHFRGPTATGKTTLALHVAGQVGRPVVLIHGDEEFTTSDLVGGEHGYRMHKVIDNFIHSVLKTEEDMSRSWVDSRLTIATRYGFTLLYDEFNRSRPEANNVLLSVLQERLLGLPPARGEGDFLRVHPNFVALFTSNPEEYAGVFRSQDALRDRMATVDLGPFDEETEIAITQAKGGLSREAADRVVKVVRGVREAGICECPPSVRVCLLIARVLKAGGDGAAEAANPFFRQLCLEALTSETSRAYNRAQSEKVQALAQRLIDQFC